MTEYVLHSSASLHLLYSLASTPLRADVGVTSYDLLHTEEDESTMETLGAMDKYPCIIPQHVQQRLPAWLRLALRRCRLCPTDAGPALQW